MIRQGDVVRVDFGEPRGSEPGFVRPCVVIQRDELNASRLGTVIVVPVTSNLRFAEALGNVRLRKGEANLSKPSVVQVCHVMCIDRSQIDGTIGHISRQRLAEIIAGILLIIDPG